MSKHSSVKVAFDVKASTTTRHVLYAEKENETLRFNKQTSYILEVQGWGLSSIILSNPHIHHQKA